MASNTQIQVSNLDFVDIKQNFINYLQKQDVLKDYNYTGSALSTLLDVLAYNTQYNAFYLNMVANEMFMDSALQRSSVVSHAKLMNYVPQSAVGPVASVNVAFYGVTTPTFTLPQYTRFISGSINNKNYPFVTQDVHTVASSNGVAYFTNVTMKQGTKERSTFTVNSVSNPKYIFEITDSRIDTTTLQVAVQQSSSNSYYEVFNSTTDFLSLGPNDRVYFLQEAINGNYQIYFGDGILGKQLEDGNIISIDYISTKGTAGAYANSFSLMDSVGSYTSVQVIPYSAATQGKEKESIDSIKFQAPKSFAAQGRAVSKNDYMSVLQQNNLGIQFDSVSVWGGEENDPPAYGQVFIALKPKGAYDLTDTQKQLLVSDVLKPVSVLTVAPTIVDPDYTYIQLNANVVYQSSKTSLNPVGLQSRITEALYNYSANNLNTFNATLSSYDVINTIRSVDPSIISSDFTINLQKKFNPQFSTPTTYNMFFNTSLKKGGYQNGITSFPGMVVQDPSDPLTTISNVYIEEVPTFTGGVSSISVINPGYSYQSTPTVKISGDGVGATAVATIVNGSLKSIAVANTGSGYTSATVTIIPADGDNTGQNAAATVNLEGQYGTLRTYYNNVLNVKTIVSSNVGKVDYINGIVTLNNFSLLGVDDPLGQLTLSVVPSTTIVSSTYNRIITIDPFDPSAIQVKTVAKNS